MKTFTMPWGAWYGDKQRRFELPDAWEIDYFGLDADQKVSPQKVETVLDGLSRDLTDKKPASAVIVVDDLTRPVQLDGLLPQIVTRLVGAGVKRSAIKVLIGLGSHAPLSDGDLRKKLGNEIVDRLQCINHDPGETKPIGMEWGKTEIRLNRHYLAAEYKIVVSGLTPHSFAGFSGGAKMLVPGIADMETLAKTHKSVLMGFMGKLGTVEQNKFRDTIESFVHKAGLDFFVGLVLNPDRSIRDLFGGHFVEAHRQASLVAAAFCTVPADGPYDVVISSAYPKDTELLQAENAMIPLKSKKEGLIREDGTLILMSACSQGVGHHGLFGAGGRLYRKARPLRLLKPYNVAFFVENVDGEGFSTVFSEDYFFTDQWIELLNHISVYLPPSPKVAIFPYGSMQLVK